MLALSFGFATQGFVAPTVHIHSVVRASPVQMMAPDMPSRRAVAHAKDSPTQTAADAYIKAYNAKDAAAAQATFAASVSRASLGTRSFALALCWLARRWSHRGGDCDRGRVSAVGNNKGLGAPKPLPTEKIIGALKGVMFDTFGFTMVEPAVTIKGTQAVIDTKLKIDTTLPAWETASGKPAPFPQVPVKEMVRGRRSNSGA
jgi:hypothetical protein